MAVASVPGLTTLSFTRISTCLLPGSDTTIPEADDNLAPAGSRCRLRGCAYGASSLSFTGPGASAVHFIAEYLICSTISIVFSASATFTAGWVPFFTPSMKARLIAS
jgi:hypothetical protein